MTEPWLLGSQAAGCWGGGQCKVDGRGQQELASSERSVFSLSANNL